jgi:RNA polymerase sigma factor (TIGR02999 family)
MSAVTTILQAIEQGSPEAANRLLPVVYEELRRLAARKLASEAPGQTFTPTALVHEAYLRLVGNAEEIRWDSRGHFFAAAAEAMRRILVDEARRKRSRKRGGDQRRIEMDLSGIALPEKTPDLLELDEALTRLAAVDAAAADLVKLRYFSGLSITETAQALGISPRTANRLWTYARAWLHEAITRA